MASWRGKQGVNRYFVWVTIFALVLLATVLALPSLARLFSFSRPPLPMLLMALGTTVLSMLWFEAVKLIFPCPNK